MKDLQLSTLHILVFFFSKTRKSMNMPISARKKEHLFSRIKGYFFIIDVSQTKTFFPPLWMKSAGSKTTGRQIYLQYIVYYIYTHICGDHGDNKLHISQNILATAFFCCFHHITYIVISHIVISHITCHILHFSKFL